MVWEIRPWRSAKPVLKQRLDALASGLRSQERLHVFFKTFLCLCQLVQKQQARSWKKWGWMGGWMGGWVLDNTMLWKKHRAGVKCHSPKEHKLHCLNLDGECYFIGVTNCRYLLWLWVRVSGRLANLLRGSQGFDWLLHLTVHNPPDQLSSPAAAVVYQ